MIKSRLNNSRKLALMISVDYFKSGGKFMESKKLEKEINDCILRYHKHLNNVDAMNGLYQCPYDKACMCKMDEPCNGCETWATHH